MGPYVSQNCLDKPEIKNLEVIEPSDLENANAGENNRNVHVRFKDESNNFKLDNKSYIDLNTSNENNNVANPASLRNLKDAFNNFSRKPSSKRDNGSQRANSNLPVIPINANNANYDQDGENVYSISKSFNNQQPYAETESNPNFAAPQPRQSFENLYSQVKVQHPNTRNENQASNSYNNDNGDQQPVYMNTSFDDQQSQRSNLSRSNRLI